VSLERKKIAGWLAGVAATGAACIAAVFCCAPSAAAAGACIYRDRRDTAQPLADHHAAVVGFLGNEIVARYRIRVGRQIGSAALVADGLHARTDGFTSLAVLLGAGGVAVGWSWADPVVGLLITVAILGVLRSAIRQVGALWTPTWWITRRRDQHRAGRHRG
jgi:divalent metal cation (Fe/Co/Zn/Cd) transporter